MRWPKSANCQQDYRSVFYMTFEELLEGKRLGLIWSRRDSFTPLEGTGENTAGFVLGGLGTSGILAG